jgi:hypothetical protein
VSLTNGPSIMIIGRLGVFLLIDVHLSQTRYREVGRGRLAGESGVARETRLFFTIPLASKVGIHPVTSRLAVPRVPHAGPRREGMRRGCSQRSRFPPLRKTESPLLRAGIRYPPGDMG